MQKVWMKALRHLIAFAIDQGELKGDPTIGIKTARPAKSSGHVTGATRRSSSTASGTRTARWHGSHSN